MLLVEAFRGWDAVQVILWIKRFRGGAYEFERGFGVPINSSIGCGEETETEVAPKSE